MDEIMEAERFDTDFSFLEWDFFLSLDERSFSLSLSLAFSLSLSFMSCFRKKRGMPKAGVAF